MLKTVELLEVFRAREGRCARQKINLAAVLLPSLRPQGPSLCSWNPSGLFLFQGLCTYNSLYLECLFPVFTRLAFFLSFPSFRVGFKCLLLRDTFPHPTPGSCHPQSLSVFLCLFLFVCFCSKHFSCSKITFLVCLPGRSLSPPYGHKLHEGKELFFLPSHPQREE